MPVVATTAIASMLLPLIGCGPPKTNPIMPIAWAAGPSEPIGRTDAVGTQSDYFNAGSGSVSLRGAVNETVAFSYALRADNIAITGVQIMATDLAGPAGRISADAVQLYRHWPITIDRYPNWYLRSIGLREPRQIPDALVPIDAPQHGQPYIIPRNENLVMWVEIRIPASTNVGRYAGELVVRSAAGGSHRTPIILDVLDLFTEPERALPVIAKVELGPIIRSHTRVDPNNPRLVASDPDARRVIRETFALLHDHGLSPVTDEIYPRLTQDLDGSLLLQWDDYDAVCGPLIDGSAYHDSRPAAAWPVPANLEQPDPSQYGGVDSTTYAAVLSEYLANVAEHFRQKEWLGQSYIFFNTPRIDEAEAGDFDRVRRLATMTHFVEPNLPFASRLIPQSMAPFGWFEHVFQDLSSQIDIWVTPARYQHPPTLRRLQTFGKRTWLPPDRPPYSGSLAVEAPPVHARSLPWQAYLQGHEAILLDSVTSWPDEVFDDPIRNRQQRSDAWLVYPGTMFGLSSPVPSVRLKQLQLGLQDHQRLRQLTESGRKETARLVASSLIKAAGTDAYGDNYQDGLPGRRIENPATWELARRILDDELRFTLRPPTTTQPDETPVVGAPREDWISFLEETRTIEAWTESTRLRRDERPGQEGWMLTFEAGVRSELRTPVEGEFRFGGMPTGMRNISDVVRVGPLNEWAVARRQLVAKSEALPVADLDGHFVQPVIFDAGANGRVDVAATVSVVQAPKAPLPITIDGKLSDWPPSAFNAAGDFRLVSNRDGIGRERRRAESQTIAYFLVSRGLLYIGVHAGVPKRDSSAASDTSGALPMQNFVEYEDLMPVGEDLIEIILDPTNKGTQSGDLYHIVLKSTGNPRFERGIGTHPPIGEVKPWVGPLPECCVVRTEFGWSAEVAIPLESFGADAAFNRVWGLNIARLEPMRGEYSDWARAPRYCYDPRSLGNLVWPE